ncbi:Predicted acetyltransferase [Actinokineospora alba]|uniref:Predicted acetyltransferase n=1 Tax=Actinokineospora alba TaxID=504798 RepID=A0A1H0S2V7_9PSEU|nr:putative acetyltransferase [Actinokineospora alba]SDI49621.1 Predicted acetyltransferase [Actinokineospora alba]SDP36073.1 Predicted acetyltransferase [Actinokineospora alba]
MVTIRPYAPEHADAVHRMRKLAFGSPRDDAWAAESAAWRGFVADVDGATCGTLRIWAYHQFFGGRAVPAGGIATVAVDPHARGRGVAGALLDAALAGMREAGQPLSILFAATPPLYRGRGWEQVGSTERVQVPISVLAALPPGRAPVRRATEADLPALHQLYLDVASTVDGMLDRSEPAFQVSRIFELDIVDVVSGDDGLRGYVAASRPSANDLTVWDLVVRDAEAALTLLGRLSSWTGMVEVVSLRLVDPVVHDLLLGMPRDLPRVVEPFMLRVVDLAAAVEVRGWPDYLPDFAVDLEITDEHAPWNAGGHRLVHESGAMRLEPGGTGAVRLHARALGPWFAGTATTDTLRRAGLLEGDAPMLDAATTAPRQLRIADNF